MTMYMAGMSAGISIHTPHAGSDQFAIHINIMPFCISIHTPHAGSDTATSTTALIPPKFQSTLPMRGATVSLTVFLPVADNFNPHSPCGERPFISRHTFQGIKFQSTLPMRGATVCGGFLPTNLRDFNPHSPCGERRRSVRYADCGSTISIHTPHAGSDFFYSLQIILYLISIHTPHAGSDYNV